MGIVHNITLGANTFELTIKLLIDWTLTFIPDEGRTNRTNTTILLENKIFSSIAVITNWVYAAYASSWTCSIEDTMISIWNIPRNTRSTSSGISAALAIYYSTCCTLVIYQIEPWCTLRTNKSCRTTCRAIQWTRCWSHTTTWWDYEATLTFYTLWAINANSTIREDLTTRLARIWLVWIVSIITQDATWIIAPRTSLDLWTSLALKIYWIQIIAWQTTRTVSRRGWTRYAILRKCTFDTVCALKNKSIFANLARTIRITSRTVLSENAAWRTSSIFKYVNVCCVWIITT